MSTAGKASNTLLPSSVKKPGSPMVAAWMVTAVFMLSNSTTPFYVHWQQQMGFSSGTLSVIFALYIVGLIVTLLVSGQLSDHFGRRPVLIPGLVAAIVACGLFADASSVGMLAIGRLLAGVAVGVIVSAGMAAVVDVGGVENKRHAALIASMAMVLGAGLGPLMAGAMAQTLAHPVKPAFFVEGVILLTALIVALRVPVRPLTARALQLRLPHVPAENRRHVLSGIATFGPGITATSFVLALGPSLLSRLLDVHSPLLAGGMACAMFVIAALAQMAVRQWHVKQIFTGSAASTVLAMISLALAVHMSSVVFLVLAALFSGAGQGLGQLGGLTLIGTHMPDANRAQANAVLNLGGYIPAGLLPVAAGYLIDTIGLGQAASTFALVLTITALIGGVWARAQVNA